MRWRRLPKRCCTIRADGFNAASAQGLANNTINPTSASANGLQRSRVIVVFSGRCDEGARFTKP
jgi:hypothetical protein